MASAPQQDPQQDWARAFELLARVPYGRVASSMRALPFLASARHIVADGRLLLRMHRGHGYHEACVGGVVAYGADNLGQETPEDEGQWSVQCVGTCDQITPTPTDLTLFGPTASDPVYLCVTPQFVTVHELRGSSPSGD
ncbi:pyridoxamine 5'-phosphate oxidase family protein [Streptomyces sp. WG-D5]